MAGALFGYDFVVGSLYHTGVLPLQQSRRFISAIYFGQNRGISEALVQQFSF